MSIAVDMVNLFSRTDGSPEREVTLAAFNALFTDALGTSMNTEDLRAALASEAKVWTWTRLRKCAEQVGTTAESAAHALGFTDATSD